MVFKKIKAVTPSQRHLLKVKTTNILSKKKPIKKKTKKLKKKSGRNHSGQITIHHRGGGHKKKYRLIEFKREKKSAVVTDIEYDPNRTSYIARIKDNIGNESYILAPKDLKIGATVQCKNETTIQIGNSMILENMPIGSLLHNLSLKPNQAGKYIRSAGTFGQLIQKSKIFGRIKLPSGEQRYIPLKCSATLGIVSNENHKDETLGKAGRRRWLGKRPTVRGVAMNPIDHPHGGGEGKTSGGRPSVTPWGKPTKGQPTRKKKKKDIFLIENRKTKKNE
jgi:large subunit ribosomal protein L2